MSNYEVNRDRAVAESRLVKWLGRGARYGSLAVATFINFKHGPDSVPVLAANAVPGVILAGLGIRVGLEQGAARRRVHECELFGDFIGPLPSQEADTSRTRDLGIVAANLAPIAAGVAAMTAKSVTESKPYIGIDPLQTTAAATFAGLGVWALAAGEYMLNDASATRNYQPHLTAPLVVYPRNK